MVHVFPESSTHSPCHQTAPSLGGIQAQCLLEPGWGKQEAQSCGLPLGPFHPDPLLCPGSFATAAPCGVKSLQSGEVTRRWPAHFSTVTSLKTHAAPLWRVLLAVVSGKVTSPLGARQHQEFSSGQQPVPTLHSHTEGTRPCCQDGEVACFCLPAFVKEGLS